MLDYQNKEWPVCIPVYFLEPQLEYIGKYHQKRIEPFLEKIKKVTKEQTETSQKGEE